MLVLDQPNPKGTEIVKLKTVVASLDEVAEPYRSLYVEKNGKFYLQAEGDIDEIAPGLLANQRDLLGQLSGIKDKLKAYEGLDPEAARKALKAAEDAARKKAQEDNDFESLKTQLTSNFEKEKAALTAQIAELEGALGQTLIESQAATLLAAKGVKPSLLMPHIKGQSRVVKTESGVYVARVVDPVTGKDAIKDSAGNYKTLDDLIAEFEKNPDYAPVFPAQGVGGMNTQHSQQQGLKPGVKQIKASDTAAQSASLEDIASGKAVVVEG